MITNDTVIRASKSIFFLLCVTDYNIWASSVNFFWLDMKKTRKMFGNCSKFKDIQDTNNIGISGVNIISNRNISPARRLIWFTLLLFMCTVMTGQVVKRLQMFFSNPVAVNFEVQYEKYVRFPVILICNFNEATTSGTYGAVPSDNITDGSIDNNLFRFYIDYTAVLNMQLFLNSYASLDKALEKIQSDYKWLFDSETRLTNNQDFQQSLIPTKAHNLHSMLIYCVWQIKDCNLVTNFTTVFKETKMGSMETCYAFNFDRRNPLYTAIPGYGGGVSLILNVQQYEYMSTDMFGAGLKVAISDSIEEATASVNEMFLQVPAGMSVSLAIKRVNYSEVRPPIGKCNETHSYLACLKECRSRMILDKCGCRPTWMEGDPPLCSLYQTLTCVDMLMYRGLTTSEANRSCNCKPKCFRTEYGTSMTFSPMSHYMANNINFFLPAPKGLEGIGRIQDWAYLEKRNRSFTNKLYSIGRLLKQISNAFELRISDTLICYKGLLSEFSGIQNHTWKTNKSNSLENLQNLVYQLHLHYVDIFGGLSKSFFFTDAGKTNISNADDEVADDFYVRCANDILRHNGSYMDEFYFQIKDKIQSQVPIIYELDNIMRKIIDTLNISTKSSGLQDVLKDIDTEFNDLKQNLSLMYNMYMEVYTLVHSDPALLRTKDWGKEGTQEDFYRQNYVQLNIYYDSLSTTRIEQFETDSITSLICDLGGNIGLWLGGSILTLFEIIDLICTALVPRKVEQAGVVSPILKSNANSKSQHTIM